MNEWRIREATARDADTLALIGSATFLDAFAGVLERDAIVKHCAGQHSAEAYRAYLAVGCEALLVEMSPGHAPIGFTLVGPPDLDAARDGDVELKRIYTLSRFHGSGLGADLLDAVVTRAAGFERLLLGVYAQNHRALAFYRKHGFESIGTRKFEVGGNLYDDEVLARPLPPSPSGEGPGVGQASCVGPEPANRPTPTPIPPLKGRG